MLAIGEDFRTVPICADARWRSKMIVLNSEIPPNFFSRTEMLRIELPESSTEFVRNSEEDRTQEFR